MSMHDLEKFKRELDEWCNSPEGEAYFEKLRQTAEDDFNAIQPPEFYRLLEHGEYTQAGDLFHRWDQDGKDEWVLDGTRFFTYDENEHHYKMARLL